MLTCKDISKKSDQFVDGELSFRQRVAVGFHLLMCVHCRRYMQQLSSVAKVVGRSQKSECTDAQADEIANRLLDDHILD